MTKLSLLVATFVLFSGNVSYAKSRSSTFINLTQSSLDGEPSSAEARSLGIFAGGIRYKENIGFGVGGYFSSEYNSAKVTKAGFDLVTDKKVSFDARTIGIQFGYLFPTNTELSFGLGNKVVEISQEETSTTIGAMDYRISISQTVYKSFGMSVFGSQTGDMTRRNSSESDTVALTSYGVGFGYVPTFDD